ncbi:MAG: MATE family efflux transporter, partial [Bacteroidales bacterium]|nr:MATE family efflux transporter [Bacteroidales bacterium]
GKPGKLILQFAAPMLIGNVFQQLYNVVDSIIVGNFLGKEALAAVGASFPLLFILISFVIGIASGSTIIISQYFGAKDMKQVRRSIDTMWVFLFFSSLVVTGLGIAFSRQIFELIKLPADVMPQALSYFNVYLGGIILFFGFNATSAILRGLGDSKTPLYFLVIATITNILLDLLFIVVFKWGVEGAAIATIISQGGAFITAVIYLNHTHPIFNLSWRKIQFDRQIFRKSINIGVPSGLQQTFVSMGMLALYRIVNDFGTDTVAAYSVALRIDSLATLPAMNFAVALSTYVGQNLGANKQERVGGGLWATFKMSSYVSLAVSLLVVLLRKTLMGMFTDDPAVIAIGAEYLLIVCSFYILFSAMFVIGGVLRGAGDTLFPMFITLIALWVIRIPVSWILSRHMGAVGIWWAIPTGWAIGAVFSFIYFRMGQWKKKTVIRYPKVEKPNEDR